MVLNFRFALLFSFHENCSSSSPLEMLMVDWLLELSELLLLELDFSLRFFFLLPPARGLCSPLVDSPLGSFDEVLGWRGLFLCVRSCADLCFFFLACLRLRLLRSSSRALRL
jgi:hypothetical protein